MRRSQGNWNWNPTVVYGANQWHLGDPSQKYESYSIWNGLKMPAMYESWVMNQLLPKYILKSWLNKCGKFVKALVLNLYWVLWTNSWLKTPKTPKDPFRTRRTRRTRESLESSGLMWIASPSRLRRWFAVWVSVLWPSHLEMCWCVERFAKNWCLGCPRFHQRCVWPKSLQSSLAIYLWQLIHFQLWDHFQVMTVDIYVWDMDVGES